MKCRLFEGEGPKMVKGKKVGEPRDAQIFGAIAFPGAASLVVRGGKEVRVEGKGSTVVPVQTKDDNDVATDAIYDLDAQQLAHCGRSESPYRVELLKEDKKAKKETKKVEKEVEKESEK